MGNETKKLFSALKESGLTISSAESFTGGFFSNELTNIEGSSDVFLGSVISYSNDVKINLLGVDPKAIKEKGVISEVVVKQMAEGANAVIGSDVSVSFSGNAGNKSWDGKEPGVCWIGLNTPTKSFAKEFKFNGTRKEIKEEAVKAASKWILSVL